MDSIRRFFTLEEDSFSPEHFDSFESFDHSEALKSQVDMPSVTKNEAPPRQHLFGVSKPAIPAVTERKAEIVVLEPVSFADARDIAETLKEKKCILLNMRRTDKELARRIVDFLSGISYAIDGHSQKVADQIYIFTPEQFEIVIAQQKEHNNSNIEVVSNNDAVL